MADSEVEFSARLDALRESGADRASPVRFAYLSALARRAAEQPEPIRRRLAAKIAREADELAGRPLASEAEPTAVPGDSPLAGLLAYIGEQQAVAPPQASRHESMGHPCPESRPTPAPELKSVAYFRDAWSKLSTEQQLTQTLAQAPENAGPMNSQHLVLRALQVMRECAPDYLQGFMSYVDTLIWLEHASPVKPNPERTPRRSPGKRSATPGKASS